MNASQHNCKHCQQQTDFVLQLYVSPKATCQPTSQQQLFDYTKTAYRACARVRVLLLHALRCT
jgi:hypothetical protein